uniref:GK21539 n=1 Tax=Drosophila willistoni TaxID=7260 RepID=B4MPU0_DROWI
MPHHHHHRLLQTNSQNNLTFLKSNYKFKRRNMLTMRALPVPTTTEARTPNQLAATLSKTSAAEAAKAAAVPSHKCRTILSLFIAIAWNIVQESANWFLQQAGRIDRLAIPDDAGHDVNTAPLRHRCTRIAGTADDANDKVSTAREQQQQQQQPQPQPHQQQLGNDYLASSSQPCTRTTSGPGQQHHQLQLHSGQPLMTLLIGLLLLNISLAAAGTCWQTHLGSGKCNQIFSTNITKTECCGASQTFSYTDRELSSVEYFFATAIGGGVECAPCMENCKSFKCGPNKKCVKRKGRPKCVCAPECGAALRRKQQQEQHEQQQQQQQKHWGIKTQRGSRSLSSEITNINLDINGAKRQRKHSDIADNQRKSEQGNPMPMPMPMPQRQSQKKALGETKHRRLLIIDSSSSSSSSGSQSKTNNGRVEMRGYETRRRHRNNHGKHLTRSMMTGANDSTPAHQTTQSRHKLANANEPANDINRQQQQQQQQQPRRRNNKKHNKDQRIRIVAGTSAAAAAASAATTTSSTTTTLLTVNTTMSVSGSGPHRRRLYQNEHGSEMAASSAQSQSHSHLANADDLAFLGGIYEPVVLQHSNPVCGSDGRTYNTECQLRKRACRSNNAQLEVAYRGHCKTSCHGVQCLNGLMCVEDQYMMPHCISCNIECPRHNGNRRDNDDGDDDDDELDLDGYGYDGDYDEERAVCGVDGKTYRSACDINRMICKIGRSIAVAYPGPCRADRVSCADIKCGPKDTCLVDLQTQMPRCVSCRYKCSRKRQQQSGVDKICGFNNHTYNSWCEMRKDSCATGYFIGVKAQGSC